jgi:prolyl-tRNA synthetase
MNNLEIMLTGQGLVCRIGGEIAYTPKGKQLKSEIENTVRRNLNSIRAEEVELPLLVDYSELRLERSISRGRCRNSFSTSSRDPNNETERLLLARTAEELAANYFSQNGEDGIIYQIRSKFRNEDSRELSFLKRREFTMLDAYSSNTNILDSQKTYQNVKHCFKDILENLNIPYSTEIVGSSNVQSEEFICELERMQGSELGHIFHLGNLYTKPYGLENATMGSYGLGIDRLFAAVAINGGIK